jgi:Flp pilus assembly protein TadB
VKRRRVAWGSGPPSPLPKRPYRDTVLVNVGLAVTIVLVAWLTGGRLRNAVIIAVVFFVVATLWSFRVWRRKLREADLEARRRR